MKAQNKPRKQTKKMKIKTNQPKLLIEEHQK